MKSDGIPSTSAVVIGLLWHSVNSTNLGVGALTAAHIEILGQVAREAGHSVRFVILGWRDPEPAYVTGPAVEVVGMRARDVIRPGGLYAAVRRCDLVLDISAGDSFADIYGGRRFMLNILGKLAVLAARRALILSPQTIGPFRRWGAKMLAGWTMRGASHVVTRDALSSAYLREMGLEGKLVEATDVAFRLPYEAPPQRTGGPVRVGLNISGLLFNGGYTKNNMFGLVTDYPALARALCAYFSGLPCCELHLVGHVNSQTQIVEDDYRVAEQLAAEFPGTILAPRFESPSAAKSYIAAMDFFAGSRMHACIAAFSALVPVLPIAYSRKFVGLFGTLGYYHLADCKQHNVEEILAIVTGAFEQREELRAEVEAALDLVGERLSRYEAVLRDAMAMAARRAS